MFNFTANNKSLIALRGKLAPSTDCSFVLLTMKNSWHSAVKLVPSISLQETLAKTRAT